MRFGRDFEFDVVDLTLKHSIIGFVTLLVLKCSQSFVVVDVIEWKELACIVRPQDQTINCNSNTGILGRDES